MIAISTRLISFLSGKAASIPLPQFIRALFFTAYAQVYGANLTEIEKELGLYKSLGDFFTRSLLPGLRKISDTICSPADGKISGLGKITNQELLQAKGKNYTLGELLLDGSLAAEFEGGNYYTIYLAPGDYHRVHSPVSGVIESVRHIPGAMFPVSPFVATRRERLFSRNERVCLIIETTEYGKVCLVFVGALNVGSISLNCLELKTNNTICRVFSPPPFSVELVDQPIAIGEEIGKFNLGSTVIVITSKEIPLKVVVGDKVRMGQAMCSL